MKTKIKTKLVFKLREMQKKKEGDKSGITKVSGDALELLSDGGKRRNSVNMGLIHEDVEYVEMVEENKEFRKKNSLRKQSTMLPERRKESVMISK